MSIKLYLFTGLLLIVFFFTQAQDTLTLEQAIKETLEHNHDIQIVKNNVQISQNNATPGNAGMLPKIEGNAGSNYTNKNTKLEFAGGIPPVEQKGAVSTLLNASIGLSYTLFDGLGTIQNFNKLKTISEISEVQARLTIENTLIQVVTAYYEVALLSESFQIDRDAVNISFERFQRIQNKNNFGAATSLDVLNARVDLNADSINLAYTGIQLQNAKRNLNTMLARNVDEEFEVQAQVNYDKTLQLNELKTAAIRQNAEIIIANYNKKLSELDLKIAQAARLPRVDISSSYGISQSKSDAGILLLNQNTGFSGGLNLSVPIFDGIRKNIQLQNAKIRIENSREQSEAAMQKMEKEISNTYAVYQNNLGILKIEVHNIEAVRLNFKKTKELYELGQVTNTQFREAQLNLFRAKSRFNTVQYNTKLTEIKLLQLSGWLLK